MAKNSGRPGKLAVSELVKWIVSFLVSIAVLAGCVALYEYVNAPVPGEVFTGRAQGMFCEIVAEVTVADGKIVDVKLTGADETPSLGGVVLEEMPAKILAAQSTDVDGMTGATVTSDAARHAVTQALIEAGVLIPAETQAPTEEVTEEVTEAPTEEVTEAAPAGEVFTGKAQGMFCEIVAEVTVADGKIVDVKLTGEEETPSLGGVVLAEMPAKILEAQSADVDGMTGATVTTDAVKAAVTDALVQAGLVTAPVETVTEAAPQAASTAIITADEWAEKFPEITASYKATAENTYTVAYLETDPYLVNLYEGFGFAKQYDSARGHEYSLEDLANTARPHPLANCLTCKTADFTKLVQDQGVSAYSLDFNEVMASMNESVGCYNCHANEADSGKLVVTHDYFIDKLDMTGIDAATLSCGQCHIEYYFEPDTKATTIPYTNTAEMTSEAMLEYYDAMDFADWTQPSTGAKLLKAQHPEMETYLNGSIHAKFGLSCASCHMEKVTENGVSFTSHNLVSPLESQAILDTCAACHKDTDMTEKVHAIQDQVTAREKEVGNNLSAFKDQLAQAVASGEYTEEELDAIRVLYRHAQWFFDYQYVENSEGAHNSKLANDCLDKAAAKIEEGMQLFHAA